MSCLAYIQLECCQIVKILTPLSTGLQLSYTRIVQQLGNMARYIASQPLGISLFCFYFHLFFSNNSFFSTLLCSIFCSKYILYFYISLSHQGPAKKAQACLTMQLQLQLLNNGIIQPQLHNDLHIMDSYRQTDHELVIQLYIYGGSKCQFLTKPNILIVLLEYIDLLTFE